MKCYKTGVDAHGSDLIKETICKVQSCRRSSSTSFISGIYGLISVLVLKLVCDIGRQGHLSQRVQHLLPDTLISKSHKPASLISDAGHLGFQPSVTESDLCPRTQLFARAH